MNNQHAVAVARNNGWVLVHDAGYNAAAHKGNVRRVETVAGLGMVRRMAPVGGVRGRE
jgi:hypothetical protein